MFNVAPPDMPKAPPYEPQALNTRHRLIIQMHVQGYQHKEIAQRLGITEPVVRYTLESEIGREQVQAMMEAGDVEAVNVREEISRLAPVALRVLEDVVNGDEPTASVSLRVKTAQDLLDRAGHGAVHRVDAEHRFGYLNELEKIKDRAKRSGMLAGQVVDVTPEGDEDDG